MPSTYVNDLRLEEMATGEKSGTWGTITNTNLELIASAFSYGTEDLASDADATITMSDGSADEVRSIYLKITSSASLTTTRTITLAPNTVSKLWIIENATTGGQSISISQGSGANVTVPNGGNKIIVTDGAGAGAAVYDALADQDVDITSGTIDGTVIGGSSAAAGTFTTFTSTGIDDNASSTAVTINSSNNVGIGNSSPAEQLHIGASNNTTHNAVVVLNNGGATGARGAIEWRYENITTPRARISVNSSSQILEFDTAGSERMRIDGSGNVGIGTSSPAKKLDVSAGDIRLNDGYTLQWGGTNNRISGSNSSNFLQFVTSGVEAIRIDSSGNVGIGTNSPAKQLEITKSARATITSLTDGATITPDFDAAQNFAVTLGGNRTLANPSNIDAGQTGSIFVTQDGTGSRTLSFGSYWDFAGGTAPTLSTAAGAVDRIDYIVRTGTSIHAVATLNLS